MTATRAAPCREPAPAHAMPSAQTLAALRAFLEPVWWRIHRSDLTWNVTDDLPSVASHAMCRHACAFMRRLSIDADRRDGLTRRSPRALAAAWKVVRGQVAEDRLPIRPLYLRRDATHFAVLVDGTHLLDLTADQFGLDPCAPHPWEQLFRTEPVPGDPGLSGSARTWAADAGYPSLLARLPSRR